MTGAALVRRLLRTGLCTYESFVAVCNSRPELRTCVQMTRMTTPDIVREMNVESYVQYLEANLWLLDVVQRNGSGSTLNWSDVAGRLPREFFEPIRHHDQLLRSAELFVWLFHAQIYEGITIADEGISVSGLTLTTSSSSMIWHEIAKIYRAEHSWQVVAASLGCTLEELQSWVKDHISSAVLGPAALKKLVVDEMLDSDPPQAIAPQDLPPGASRPDSVLVSQESNRLIAAACAKWDTTEPNLLASLYDPATSWEVASRFKLSLRSYLLLVRHYDPAHFLARQHGPPICRGEDNDDPPIRFG